VDQKLIFNPFVTGVTEHPLACVQICKMEIAGYIASLFIGISLGLIGGGGSILTVPVLVYLFSTSPALAVSYSLFIVGITSLAGAFNNYRKGLLNFKIFLLFGSSSVVTVFILRKFIVPLLPKVFFSIGSLVITQSLFIMVVFAILMIAASVSMIRNKKPAAGEGLKTKPQMLILYGILIGIVTGFLGAGGGFLLIPALVIFMKVPIKEAIGTSLLIIAVNALVGFAGDSGRYQVEWSFLIRIAAIAVAGIFIGGYFNQKINAVKLKKIFGWFVLIVGLYIITREIFLN
jgi:uncharacterized membrane protein YfcA